tara:strand:- start:43 stop:258 length:216 start_codon:yes stop_codon:yes gene_type:complete
MGDDIMKLEKVNVGSIDAFLNSLPGLVQAMNECAININNFGDAVQDSYRLKNHMDFLYKKNMKGRKSKYRM